MNAELDQLFVYGSLLSGFHHPAYQYISRYFALIGPATVKGKLFDMGEYPAAIPVQEETFIQGELYKLKHKQEFSWAFRQLDDYEGLIVEPGETPLYKREPATVFAQGATTTAWIYWYNQEIIGKPHIASGSVLEYREQKNSSTGDSGFF